MKKIWVGCCSVLMLAAAAGVATAAPPPDLTLKQVIKIPGHALKDFDIGFVDPVGGRYYFSDRSNKSVDVFDAATRKFLFHIPGFTGSSKGLHPGPNGTLVIPDARQLWVGDGNSDVKVFDISANKPKLIATISTGGKGRADELTYDPKDKLVVVANNLDKPPFLSFISTNGAPKLVGKLALPDASDGIEQSQYFAQTGMIYASVPIYKHQNAVGGLAVVDPVKRSLTGFIKVDNCQPAGNAPGPGTNTLLGCIAGEPDSHLPAQSVIVNVATGKIVKSFKQVGGSDEAWYDPKSMRYYLAARGNPGGPVLGVINGATNTWMANLPTAKNSHSVAADPKSGAVFVPMIPNPKCERGCVAVYAEK